MIGSVPPWYSTAQESRQNISCILSFGNGDNDSVFGNSSTAASTSQLSQDLSSGFEDPRSYPADTLYLSYEDLPNSPVDVVPPSWCEYYSPGFESPRNPLVDALHLSRCDQWSPPVCKDLQYCPAHLRNVLANVSDLSAFDQHLSTAIEGFQNSPGDTRQLSYDQSYSRDFERFLDVIDAFPSFAYNQSSSPGVEDFQFLPNRHEVNGYLLQLAAARQTKSCPAQAGQKKLDRGDRKWVEENGLRKRIRRATEGGRTKQSCDQCRRKHGKCDGKRSSCGPCEEKGRCCTYTQKRYKKVREEGSSGNAK
ncbi:hypothetical protein BC938DRAFT_477495 [Jimgerdemannia flammicorona]|uniref:Zn(2)-C6 fungal-type domain-containing protein n=1 Tax=Jimgerdemannia flammicorona TaxID=994334 RepID=A0A433QP80_9FUNG|nr:hypothetical protein BC938DRAFT_477495 [Jimgerdemannia flammicorona]